MIIKLFLTGVFLVLLVGIFTYTNIKTNSIIEDELTPAQNLAISECREPYLTPSQNLAIIEGRLKYVIKERCD